MHTSLKHTTLCRMIWSQRFFYGTPFQSFEEENYAARTKWIFYALNEMITRMLKDFDWIFMWWVGFIFRMMVFLINRSKSFLHLCTARYFIKIVESGNFLQRFVDKSMKSKGLTRERIPVIIMICSKSGASAEIIFILLQKILCFMSDFPFIAHYVAVHHRMRCIRLANIVD